MEFGYDGSTASIFAGQAFGTGELTSGVYEISWDVTSASFTSGTTSANVGFEFRDRVGTSDPSDDIVIGAVRMRFEGGELKLQYSDAYVTNALVASSGTPTLGANLYVYARIDLDNAGSAGSFQVGYKYGSDPIEHTIQNGTANVGASLSLDGYRIVQQTTDGFNDWATGDTVSIDNFTLSAVPEPSTFAIIAGLFACGVIALRRRRR